MHPSTVNTTSSEMSIPSSPSSIHGHSNINSSNFYQNLNDHSSYPDLPSTTATSLNYVDLLRTWNYHRFLRSTLKADQLSDNSSSDYYPRNGSFHQCNSHLLDKTYSSDEQIDDRILLTKFHHDTLVNLDSGESKNIQQLTTNDFLTSAKQSQQYSSLLARVDYIGSVDQVTGKAELRFYIDDIDKTTFYYVSQEMPFFVYQYSCWASISPKHTQRLCGLKCRQLECGDIIIAINEQQKSSSTKTNDKPDYSQQSPTKCLVGRYMNGQISSNKRHKVSKE